MALARSVSGTMSRRGWLDKGGRDLNHGGALDKIVQRVRHTSAKNGPGGQGGSLESQDH